MMDQWRGIRGQAVRAFGVLCFLFFSATSVGQQLTKISALGRIEPQHGVFQVAGPPDLAVVIQELLVKEGDLVKKDQVIAILVGISVAEAEASRLRAVLNNAEHELNRNKPLYQRKTITDAQWKSLQLARDVAAANLQRAKAELELSKVRAPIDGQVLVIHAKAGELVGSGGIAELGDTSVMYVVAEVYETDIGRVRIGQRAHIRSPALTQALSGQVEHIGLRIGKKDVLSTDPVEDADARVVEVDIRLDDPAPVAALTNLRVEVVIEP